MIISKQHSTLFQSMHNFSVQLVQFHDGTNCQINGSESLLILWYT